MSHYREEEERLGADIPDDRLEDEVGCLFPGWCVAPWPHTPASCHVPMTQSEQGCPRYELGR